MPTFDHLQAKALGGDITAPSASSGTSIQYPTGPITYNAFTGTYGSNVDEIDLGAGNGVAGSPGAGLGHQLWLYASLSGVTGTGTLTLSITVETDDNTSFSSAVTRFTAPLISSAQNTGLNTFYCWPLPYLPERYARIGLTPGGNTPAWSGVFAISDGGDSRFVS